MFHVAKIEHKTTPAPFEVISIDFNCDPELYGLVYGKIVFYNPYSGLKYTTSFYQMYFSYHIYTTLPFNYIFHFFYSYYSN